MILGNGLANGKVQCQRQSKVYFLLFLCTYKLNPPDARDAKTVNKYLNFLLHVSSLIIVRIQWNFQHDINIRRC